jgi:hypothetical protein
MVVTILNLGTLRPFFGQRTVLIQSKVKEKENAPFRRAIRWSRLTMTKDKPFSQHFCHHTFIPSREAREKFHP